VLAGLNALQGESLQDEPCPMDDKPLFTIGAGIPRRVSVILPQSAAFSTNSHGSLMLRECLKIPRKMRGRTPEAFWHWHFLQDESFPSPAKGGIRTEGQDES